MDIDRFSADRITYNPSTLVDASRWMVLCKLIVGQHPSRAGIINKSPAPIVAVRWSMVGLAFSILHIIFAISGMIIMMCINVHEVRSFTVIDSDLSWVQLLIVTGLNIFNMYVLFIRLFWHRSCVSRRISLMLQLERQFADVGITVELQRRRTYVRSILWSIVFVIFNFFNLSYSFYMIVMAVLPWNIIVIFVAMAIMPSVYKQSMVLFYLYDLAETKRFLIHLNEILRAVLQAERRRGGQ